MPITPEPAADITMYEDGPLLVRGSYRILDQDGNVIDPGRPTVALCRCGRSSLKPFCDGTHKAMNFRAPGRRADAAGAAPDPADVTDPAASPAPLAATG